MVQGHTQNFKQRQKIGYRMKNKIKTERILIWVLISGTIITFGLALILGYRITYNQYAGILAILITSYFFFTGSDKTLGSLFIILVLGTFNILSFGYFIDAAITFGVSKANIEINGPGIQLYSLILLIVLFRKRKDELKALYRKYYGQTNEDYQKVRVTMGDRFREKFESLSDSEVLERLEHDLVPEARKALQDIKKQRGI